MVESKSINKKSKSEARSKKGAINKKPDDLTAKELKKLLFSVFTAAATSGQGHEIMNVVSESISKSFETHKNITQNFIRKVPVNLAIRGKGKSINEVQFQDPTKQGGSNVINVQFFENAINKPSELKLDNKYKNYEFIEYQYNVSNIVTYYMTRFPEIMDLFDVFSDICIGKSDIGIAVEFSDDFIKKFFLDQFKKRLEEAKKKAAEEEKKRLAEMEKQSQAETPEDIFGPLDTEGTDQTTSTTETPTSTPSETPPSDTGSESSSPKGSGLFEDLFPATPATESGMFRLESVIGLIKSMDQDVTSVIEDPKRKEIEIYEEIYTTVVNQYRDLVSIVEKKIKGILDNKVVKRIKYATKTADMWGYSIVTINKNNMSVNVYNPTEVKIFKRNNEDFNIEEFIFAKVEGEKLVVLNEANYCYLYSLDSMVSMPMPNIVRISWYLYLLDLIEVLIIFNDLLKSKTIHLLQIPVFDAGPRILDEEGDDVNTISDSLSLMNMIINNIESKLVLDSQYLKSSSGESSEDVAMRLLKNVGLTISYVPKISENSRIDNIKLETPDNEYTKLYGLLLEKIFSVLKFPLWMRTNADVMSNFKTIAREVVQFGHLIFMSRVNSAISEIQEVMTFVINSNMIGVEISYAGSNTKIKPTFEKITVTLKNLLEDYLFDRQITETVRQTKINNILSLFSTGLEMNPKWILEYIFPEYTVADIILPREADIEAKRQEIETASSQAQSSDLFSNSGTGGGSSSEPSLFSSLFSNEPATNEPTQAKLSIDPISLIQKSVGGQNFMVVDKPIGWKYKNKTSLVPTTIKIKISAGG